MTLPILRCAPGVVWSAESDGVRLVASNRKLTVKLGYPDAAVWDFLVRSISETRAVIMIKHIGGFADESAAPAFITQCLQEWLKQGLVVHAEQNRI